MKTNTIILISVFVVFIPVVLCAQENPVKQIADSTRIDSTIVSDSTSTDFTVVVTYFHGNRRCMTCKKLEAYSQETIEQDFTDQLKDSTLVWRIVNFEEKENKHFVEDYQLYTQSLILSRVNDSKEIEWKNLDKIWQLVGDQEQFKKYVQTETKRFIEQKAK